VQTTLLSIAIALILALLAPAIAVRRSSEPPTPIDLTQKSVAHHGQPRLHLREDLPERSPNLSGSRSNGENTRFVSSGAGANR